MSPRIKIPRPYKLRSVIRAKKALKQFKEKGISLDFLNKFMHRRKFISELDINGMRNISNEGMMFWKKKEIYGFFIDISYKTIRPADTADKMIIEIKKTCIY